MFHSCDACKIRAFPAVWKDLETEVLCDDLKETEAGMFDKIFKPRKQAVLSKVEAENRLIALAVLQSVGAGIALFIHTLANQRAYLIYNSVSIFITIYLILLLAAGALTGLLCGPVNNAFFQGIKKQLKNVTPGLAIPTDRVYDVVHSFIIAEPPL